MEPPAAFASASHVYKTRVLLHRTKRAKIVRTTGFEPAPTPSQAILRLQGEIRTHREELPHTD